MTKNIILLIAATILIAGCAASNGPPSKNQIQQAAIKNMKQRIKQHEKMMKNELGKNYSKDLTPSPKSLKVQVLKIKNTIKLKKHVYQMLVKMKISGKFMNSNKEHTRTTTKTVFMHHKQNGHWVVGR